jgi:hypothetical protein
MRYNAIQHIPPDQKKSPQRGEESDNISGQTFLHRHWAK